MDIFPLLPGGKKSKGKKKSKSKRTYIPKGSRVDKSQSTSRETVYVTPKGKTFTQLTPKGKYERNKAELELGVNIFTGEVLTERQIGQRIGYNNALGEQANYYNGKKKKRNSKK